MYGLNAVALILFSVINICAYAICKSPEKRRKPILTALSLILLLGNLFRYAVLYPLRGAVRIPVEFSTVAYFVVPAFLLTGSKRLRSWAAYSGLMAGFFYYLGMIAAGGPLYHASAPLSVYVSMFCHGSIYLLGFVTIGTCVCDMHDKGKLALGVAWVAIRAALLRPFVSGGERFLIYTLLDGVCVKQVVPQVFWQWALPVYYAAVLLLVWFTILGFFRRSRKQYQKFAGAAAA